MEQKIYKDNRIWTGTMIGGPLAEGFFLYSNFRVFNKTDRAIISLIGSIMMTIILSFCIPELPKSVPKIFIPFVCTGLTYCIVKYTQQKNIDKHIEENGEIYSWIKTIMVSLICLITTISIFLVPIGIKFAPVGIKYYQAKNIIDRLENVPQFNDEIKTKEYGIQEIYFDRNIPEEIIDEFSKTLYTVVIFNDKIKIFVFISKDEDIYNDPRQFLTQKV